MMDNMYHVKLEVGGTKDEYVVAANDFAHASEKLALYLTSSEVKQWKVIQVALLGERVPEPMGIYPLRRNVSIVP